MELEITSLKSELSDLKKNGITFNISNETIDYIFEKAVKLKLLERAICTGNAKDHYKKSVDTFPMSEL